MFQTLQPVATVRQLSTLVLVGINLTPWPEEGGICLGHQAVGRASASE